MIHVFDMLLRHKLNDVRNRDFDRVVSSYELPWILQTRYESDITPLVIGHLSL